MKTLRITIKVKDYVDNHVLTSQIQEAIGECLVSEINPSEIAVNKTVVEYPEDFFIDLTNRLVEIESFSKAMPAFASGYIEYLIKTVSELENQKSPARKHKYIPGKEFVKRANMSWNTFKKYRDEGKIEFVRRGGKIYVSTDQILKSFNIPS